MREQERASARARERERERERARTGEGQSESVRESVHARARNLVVCPWRKRPIVCQRRRKRPIVCQRRRKRPIVCQRRPTKRCVRGKRDLPYVKKDLPGGASPCYRPCRPHRAQSSAGSCAVFCPCLSTAHGVFLSGLAPLLVCVWTGEGRVRG